MKLICAGMAKTGTKSVAVALRILGYTVHDVEEQWVYHLNEYVDAMEGKQIPDFAKMYANVDAVTDLPACLYWKEILAAFPDAKVLLMVRDSEAVWLESLKKNFVIYSAIMSSLWMKFKLLCTPTGRKFARLNMAIAQDKLGLNPSNPVVKAEVYTKHNAQVKASIPQNQLLVYNVKQGWKPLCEFLGVEVPDVPFPRLNVNSDLVEKGMKNSQLQEQITKELYFILAIIALLCSILLYFVLS